MPRVQSRFLIHNGQCALLQPESITAMSKDLIQTLTVNCDVRDNRYLDGVSFYFEAEQVDQHRPDRTDTESAPSGPELPSASILAASIRTSS